MGCHDHANLSSWAYARSTGFGMAQLESLIFINLPVACLALILGYVFYLKSKGTISKSLTGQDSFSRFKHSFITWDTEPNPSNSGLISTSIWCAFSSKCAAFIRFIFVQRISLCH